MGLIYIVLAQFFWATEIILVRKFFPTKNSLVLSALGCLIASLFYLPTLFFVKDKVTAKDWWIIALYALTSWFFAQIFYITGIQKGQNAFVVTMTTLTLPLFAIILSSIFLKEAITLKAVIGGIFMIMGFLILSL